MVNDDISRSRWFGSKLPQLHILAKSKYLKLPHPLTDRKFEWLRLGDKDAIIN